MEQNKSYIKVLAKALFCLILLLLSTTSVFAASNQARFAGLEFYSSSQLTRGELEKMSGIKPGASLETTQKAADKLSQKLEKQHLKANLQIIPSGKDFYLAVDLIDLQAAPTRKLSFPRPIRLANNKPMLLLAELQQRKEKLFVTGRSISPEYKNGLLFFNDEPANRIAEKEIEALAGQEAFLYQMINSDPNALHRIQAIELLSWTANYQENCRQLIDVLSDSDADVRAEAGKYINARIGLLSDDFDFSGLADAYCQQLNRPAHSDRAQALIGLAAIYKRKPLLIVEIQKIAGTKLKEIADQSIVPGVRNLAQTLCQTAAPAKEKTTSEEY
ncbi:MAG: hypothetical protein K2W82_03755 [Candidatus Obscuribacterales bacterium]|nr:hypothetical protein [Candidatus Obscuribacterales bacterium]